ncbi:MAG: hypothetical protein ACI9BW_004347, partial [Gammaproteobacteria bacterium]
DVSVFNYGGTVFIRDGSQADSSLGLPGRMVAYGAEQGMKHHRNYQPGNFRNLDHRRASRCVKRRSVAVLPLPQFPRIRPYHHHIKIVVTRSLSLFPVNLSS